MISSNSLCTHSLRKTILCARICSHRAEFSSRADSSSTKEMLCTIDAGWDWACVQLQEVLLQHSIVYPSSICPSCIPRAGKEAKAVPWRDTWRLCSHNWIFISMSVLCIKPSSLHQQTTLPVFMKCLQPNLLFSNSHISDPFMSTGKTNLQLPIFLMSCSPCHLNIKFTRHTVRRTVLLACQKICPEDTACFSWSLASKLWF